MHVIIGALVVLAFMAHVATSVIQTDNLGVPVPASNGTSTLLNVTARMEQYVGYFGDIVMMVRYNVTNVSTSSSPNYQLYNQSVVGEGKIYFFQSGDTPTEPFTTARNNSQTDGNFSLSGFYITGNHYMNNGTICGQESTDYLNTSDNYGVGIFKDSTAEPNYFLCVDIVRKASAYGFGTTAFQAVVPKTSTYTAYDVYIDLT